MAGEKTGVNIFDELEQSEITNEQKTSILSTIKTIVASHTLCDPNWTQAISSQNFLVNLAFELEMTHDDSFKNLLNVFLSSFSPQFDGGYRVNERNILIIPDENQKLIDCMKKEDEKENYHGPLSADKITNPDKIYQNFLYGIMINIANSASGASLKNVFDHCIVELLSDDALEKNRGGWVHYRLPWITARIVLGLQNVLQYDRFLIESRLYGQINNEVNRALDSMIDRIYQGKFWRSGAGEWVSKWECTGLCLEAFISSKDWSLSSKYIESIDSVVNYLFKDDVIEEWLPNDVDLSSEESTNKVLAQIVLSSVLYRYLNYDKWKIYTKNRRKIVDFFEHCVNQLNSTDSISVRQFCTIPQILYYIAKALRS